MDNEKDTPMEETDEVIADEKAIEVEEEEAAEELAALDGAAEEEVEKAAEEVTEEAAEDEEAEEKEEKYNDAPPEGDILGSLTLTYDLYDIMDVIKIQEKSRLSLRILSIAMIILPIIGVVTASINLIRVPDSSPSTLILWILVLLFVFYTYIIAPKKNAQRTFVQIDADQKAGNVSKFTVYEGGIQTDSKYGLQTFYWTDFKEVHECDAGIVLVTHTRGPVFFSKRLMENFDRERLSSILEKNFNKKYYVCDYISERNKEKK